MRVRVATPDDALAIARVRVETWRAAYAGLVPAEVLAGLDAEQEQTSHRARLQLGGEQGRLEVVADVDGEVVGWAVAGPERGGDDGELYGLYVVPGRWGSGTGHALIAEVETFLAAAGFDRAVLWVLDGNDRAARFYSSHGWLPDGATKSDDRFGAGTGWVAQESRRSKTLPQSARPKTTTPASASSSSNPTFG